MRIAKVLILTGLVILLGKHIAGASTITVTTTIQAAINSASDGDIINIPAGTYNELISINGFKKLNINGAGQGVTVIDGSGLVGDVVTISNSGKIIFQNCTVTSANTGDVNIYLTSVSNVIITRCTIENAGNQGIYGYLCIKVAIKRCFIRDNSGWGVDLNKSFNCIVSKSIIDANDYGINIRENSSNTLVSNNTVTNGSYGIANSGKNSLVKNNVITGNVFGLNHSGSKFGSIYSKNVISGNSRGTDVQEGLSTFIGNIITGNSGTGFMSYNSAYSILINNTISNNGLYGIFISDSSGYLSKNKITMNLSYSVYHERLFDDPRSWILNLIGNKITSSASYAVYFDGRAGSVLDARKNYIVDNSSIGIYIRQIGLMAFIEKNTIGQNGGTGIYALIPSMITKNNVFNNGSGIYSNENAVIYKNRVISNQLKGIYGFSDSHVSKNLVLSNGSHGIDGSGSANSLIENNKVLGNGDGVTTFDLYDESSDNIWLHNKYSTVSMP